ncbi:MAG TPA: hypothetical protein VK855_01390 [Thioalkalivibrio sp.]|nr:hypothetical protein [Thioalkalivibrio sp.]
MYENQTKPTSAQAPRAPSSGRAPGSGDMTTRADTSTRGDTSTQRTDPKFVRESFTMRKMQAWQIVALAIAAAVVIGLAVFYF